MNCTFLFQLTIVPSVIVGDKAGIFNAVPGVDPPLTTWASLLTLSADEEAGSSDDDMSPEIKIVALKAYEFMAHIFYK